MNSRTLCIAFIVVLAATGGCQGQSFSEGFDGLKDQIGSFFSNAGGDIKDFFQNVGEKTKAFKNDLLEKIKANLPDKIKEMLNSGNYSNINVAEFLNSTPPEAWNGLDLGQLPTMGKEKMAALLQSGKDKIPKRVYDQLQDLQTALFTSPTEAIATLRENLQACKNVLAQMGGAQGMMNGGGGGGGGGGSTSNGNCQMNRRQLKSLQMALGKPDKWTEGNVTAMDKLALFIPPPALRMITNKTILQKISEINDACLTTNTLADCPPEWVAKRVQAMVTMQTYGPPNRWTAQNITQMGGVNRIPRQVIPVLPPNTLKDIKPDLIAMNLRGKDAWVVTSLLAKAENVKSKDAAATKTWIDGMGSLKPYVTAADVSESVLSDTQIKEILLTNAKAKSSELPPGAAKQILKSEIKGKSIVNMTEQDVNAIGGGLLVQAPPNVLKTLAMGGKLKGEQLNKAAEALYNADGPGFEAKAREIISAMLDANNNNVAGLPEIVYPLLSGSELSGQTKDFLDKFSNEAKKQGIVLTADQAAVFTTVYPPGDLLTKQPSIKSQVSTKALKGLSEGNLKTFGMDLPPSAPANLRLGNAIWGGKTKLTAQDLRSNLDSIHLLPPSIAMKINESQISEILEVIASAPRQPSMTVCRILKDKLMMMLMNSTGVEDAEEAVKTLTPAEVENTPPCVLAAFGQGPLSEMREEQMGAVLASLTSRKNDMSMTKSARQMIVARGLKAMRVPPALDTIDVEALGEAALDLPEDRIRSLTPGGAEVLVQLANSAYSSSMKPCLSSQERSALASALEKAKGSFSDWESADGVCCLLQVLDSSQFSRIPPDVSGSCSCPSTPLGSEQAADAAESMCAADLGEGVIEDMLKAQEMLAEKQIDSALIYLWDFNSASNTRTKRSTGTSGCNKAMIGGAYSMTKSEIQDMTAAEVMSCLADLGQKDMDKEKAKVIIAKAKEARGNLTALLKQDLMDLKWAYKGLMESEVAQLPALSDPDVVAELGMYRDIGENELKELAAKVTKDFKAPKDMNGDDLAKVNQLVCGFTVDQVNALTTEAFSSAVVTLSKVEECPDALIRAMAAKAAQTYGSFSTWDAATMSEMGQLVGGLNPEDLKKIPASAYAGLTVDGIESITPEAIAVLEVDQIKNLGTQTAMAISSEQIKKFTDEMKQALESVLEAVESGSTEVAVMSLASMLTLIALTLAA